MQNVPPFLVMIHQLLRVPCTSPSGWDGNDIVIKFSDLLAQKAYQIAQIIFYGFHMQVGGGQPGATYRVRGNPRLG